MVRVFENEFLKKTRKRFVYKEKKNKKKKQKKKKKKNIQVLDAKGTF